MATQPPNKGGFRDPLNKWDALNRLREVATTDVLEAGAEVNRLQEALSQPSLSHRERLALANSLIDAKSNLEKARKASREVVNDLNSTRRLQQQINFRLGTLRSYLANNQNLSAEVSKSLASTRESLEDLLEESKDLHGSVEKIDTVLERVQNLDKTLHDLPEDLHAEMKRQTKILADIETQQRNAQDFLADHEKRVRGMYENSMKWARSKVMDVADQIGFGALNLGNFLRAGGAVARGARSVYQGAKYVNRLREAQKIVSVSKKEANAKLKSPESTRPNASATNVLRSIRDLVSRRVDPKSSDKKSGGRPVSELPADQAQVKSSVVATHKASTDVEPTPEPKEQTLNRQALGSSEVLSKVQDQFRNRVEKIKSDDEAQVKSSVATTPKASSGVDPTPEPKEQTINRQALGSSEVLSKVQEESRTIAEKQDAILTETQAIRRELNQSSTDKTPRALAEPKRDDEDAFEDKEETRTRTRSAFGMSEILSKVQEESRTIAEKQDAILTETQVTRRELKQSSKYDGQDRELARDQLESQQELTDQVSRWVQYSQGYHRRLLARLNKKGSTTEEGLFSSLMKNGLGLVTRLLPGIGKVISGLMGRSLIGRLAGKVISLIWGATRSLLGLGGRVLAGSAGLLARAGAAAIAAGASWVTRGTKFLVELGSKLLDKLPSIKKIADYGKKGLSVGRAALGGLGASGAVAAGALITAPAIGVAWSEQQNTPEGLATRIQDRKSRISELEDVIRLEKENGSRPQAYAKAEKELEQHRAGLKDLEQKLQLKTGGAGTGAGADPKAPGADPKAPGTATATATPVPSTPVPSTSVPSTPPASPKSIPGTEPRSKDAPFVGTNGSKISDYASKLFEVRGQANTDGLDPGLQANAVAMAKEYYEKTGKKIPINSGFRSFTEQAHLYATKPKGYAAAPGRSIHNFGGAFDTDSVVANELSKMGLLQKYGFERPLAHEKWHVQPVGLTLAAARAGVFSADAPKDQEYGSGIDSNTARVTSSGTSAQRGTQKGNTFTVAQATPISSGHSAGRPGQGGVSVAAAVPSTQAITEPTPPALVNQPDRARDTVGVNPQRLSTSMGANPQYGVRDIPTFDQSDSLFLALNLGVLGS